MKTIVAITIAAVAVITATAADLTTQIEDKIQAAIKANDAVAAQAWSTALAQCRAAENLAESAKMARRAEKLAQGYENILATAPAFLQAFKVAHGGKEPELDRILTVGQFLLKAWKAPQDEKSCQGLIKDLGKIDAQEEARAKAREAEWQARQEQLRKGGVR